MCETHDSTNRRYVSLTSEEVPNLGTDVMTSYEYEKFELRAVSGEAQKDKKHGTKEMVGTMG